MTVEINEQFIADLIAAALQAVEDGTSVDFGSGDEIGQFAMAILALGAGLIPVVGPALGAFTSLMGAIFFPSSGLTMDQIWEGLRERIEKLIDAKISEYHLAVLRQKISGLQENMTIYRGYLKDYQDAATAEEKQQAASTLHNMHVAYSAVVLAALPEFQVDDYAVASLLLFALVANIYLSLLVDGIKQGKDWGYSDRNIETMKAQFEAKTTPRSSKMPGGPDMSGLKSALEEAIKSGPAQGVPAHVIDTWKEAYEVLYGSQKDPRDRTGGNGDLDYPTYAKTIYARGRGEVRPYDADVGDRGGPDACKYRAYADYDTAMVMNVLSYAELWPYMSGKPLPDTVLRTLDREIFYGPFGRYVAGVPFSPTDPPAITDRVAPPTSIIIRGWDDVDGMRIRLGQDWQSWQGSSSGGAQQQLDLTADEWVQSFEVTYGQKLGRVKFVTNKGHSIQNGNARHGSITKNGSPPGYELTSVVVTNWESHIPPGCEGVVLGFRPLMTDGSRS